MEVFIPSKGRPNFKTGTLLRKAGIQYTVFVEPQDAPYYTGENVVLIEENDRGVGYARQSILEHARENGISWFWMLDDDITGLFVYSDAVGKLVREDPKVVLTDALTEASSMDGVVVAGLDFRQFAWSHKGKTLFNTQVCACVLLNADEGWFIRYPTHLMEDRAICLDAISAGYRTARFTKWAFSTPAMGQGEGGCQSIEDRGAAMKAAVENLSKKYGPGVVKPVFKEKLGWWDCRINWKAVRG